MTTHEANFGELRSLMHSPTKDEVWWDLLWKTLEGFAHESFYNEHLLPYLEGFPEVWSSHLHLLSEPQELLEKHRLLPLARFSFAVDDVKKEHIAHLLDAEHALTALHTLSLPGTAGRFYVDELHELLSSPYLSNLTDLALNRCLLSHDLPHVLSGLQHSPLRHLDISINRLESRDFAKLADNPKLLGLESLNVHENDFEKEDSTLAAKTLAQWRLKKLCWSYMRLSPKDLHTIVSSPYIQDLNTLDISSSWLDDQGMNLLAQADGLKNLEHLYCSGTRLTAMSAQRLAHSESLASSLEHLRISWTYIGDQGASELARSPYLRRLNYLDVRDIKLTPNGLLKLVNSESLPKLKSLVLSHNALAREGIEILLESSLLPQLEELYFMYTGLKSADFERIAQAKEFSHLQDLCVCEDDISAQAWRALEHSPVLQQSVKTYYKNMVR